MSLEIPLGPPCTHTPGNCLPLKVCDHSTSPTFITSPLYCPLKGSGPGLATERGAPTAVMDTLQLQLPTSSPLQIKVAKVPEDTGHAAWRRQLLTSPSPRIHSAYWLCGWESYANFLSSDRSKTLLALTCGQQIQSKSTKASKSNKAVFMWPQQKRRELSVGGQHDQAFSTTTSLPSPESAFASPVLPCRSWQILCSTKPRKSEWDQNSFDISA